MLHILETAPPQGGNYTQIIFLVAIIAIFYFFMIRPQNKKRKELMNFRSNLKKGDDVIIVPALNNEEAKKIFTEGWETVKPYLRKVADPSE